MKLNPFVWYAAYRLQMIFNGWHHEMSYVTRGFEKPRRGKPGVYTDYPRPGT